jgi:hypothetical protein
LCQNTSVIVPLELLEAACSLEDELLAEVVLTNLRLRVKHFVEVFELYEGVAKVYNSIDVFRGHAHAAKAIFLAGILINVETFTNKEHFYDVLDNAPGFAADSNSMTTWRTHKHLF